MKTMEEIYQEMLADFSARTGMEPATDGDLAVRLYAVAAQIYSLYIQSDWVVRQCFPQTATGEYLERHGALRGLERRKASKAEGVLRFSVDSPHGTNLTIPEGTVCMTAGLVRFETVEEAVLPAGSTWVEVPVRAVETGIAGNVAANTVLSMAVAPVGVKSVTNPTAILGGMEEEGDDALRERVLETFRRLPNGANTAFYEQGALGFEEVAAVSVLPRNRGIGTVDVVIATAAGMPGEKLLGDVRSWFETRREIAVDVQVLAPEAQNVNVALRIKVEEGKDTAAVLQAVKQAVTTWFGGDRLGKDVLLAELGNLIYGVEGVANYVILQPAADVTVGVAQLPRLGTLNVEALA